MVCWSGIYMILNTINNKYYIGSAVHFRLRWNTHESNLNLNKHPNRYLQSAWNKYGAENFLFVALQAVEDKSKLTDIEQNWLDWTKCFDREIGYNARPIANSNIGKTFVWTKEQIEKRAAANRGKKRSAETNRNNSLCRIGKPLSKEHKKNVGLAGIGRITSEETKIKIGLANRKKDKWPHELGRRCKCRECNDKKNQIRKDSRILLPFILVMSNTDNLNA